MKGFERSFREFVNYAIAPLILLCLYAFVFVVYKALELPAPEYFIDLAAKYYLEYGLAMLFLSSILETILFINWYVPGSSLLVIGIVFAEKADMNGFVVYAIITLGFLIGMIFDYIAGYFGWHAIFMQIGLKEPLEKMQARMEKAGLFVIMSTYFHPNLGSLAATSAGTFQESFSKFFLYSAAALFFWNAVWAVVFQFTGPYLLKFLGARLILAVLLAWLTVLTLQFYRLKNLRKRKRMAA